MNCAFVYVIWDNPKYLVGAVVSAFSLKPTCHDTVLLYAGIDVPKSCNKLFNVMEKVDYIKIDSDPMPTKKQNEIYNKDFLNKVCTKWRCLELKYKKVLFLDADIVFQANIDHLFALRAPAATFSNPFTTSYGGSIPDLYGVLRHGQRVDALVILNSLKTSVACAGSMVLLEPSKDFVKFVKKFKMHGGYSGPDEQSICDFYASAGVDFTHIDPKYQAIPWKPKWVKDPLGAPGLHYYHDKPYEIGESNGYDDTKVFWRIYNKFEAAYPELAAELQKYITYRPNKN